MSFTDQLKHFAMIIGLFVLILGLGLWAIQAFEIKPSDNAVLGFLAITTIIMAFAGAVLWKIISGEIQLTGIIAEPADPGDMDDKGKQKEVGKASLSRFQFLLFTFVIAGLFLMLSIEAGAFVDIPANVLGLIGISGGSFIVSKAVGQGKGAKTEE